MYNNKFIKAGTINISGKTKRHTRQSFKLKLIDDVAFAVCTCSLSIVENNTLCKAVENYFSIKIVFCFNII